MTALADLCSSVDYGYTASASDDPSTGPKFLRITDIVPEFIDWTSVPHCAIEEKRREKFLLDAGDIVVARTGATVGYAKQIWARPEGATFASYLVRFRPDSSKVDPYYLGQVVQSAAFKNWVKSVAGGAAQPNANAKLLGTFDVPLPAPDVQRKIGTALRAIGELIESSRRRIEILGAMARLLYREWFVHFRVPGYEEVEFVDSDLGSIPEGWRCETLADAAHLVMGQSPKSEFYNSDGVGLPFHQGVTNFGVRYPEHKNWCTDENRIAEEGDILLSVRAPVGRINVAPERLVIGRGLAALRSTRGTQVHLFESLREVFSEEDSMGGGTIFKAVTKSDLERISLVRPPVGVVESFEATVGPMFELVRNLTFQGRVLTQARDLLLPRLISGDLEVSELNLDLEPVA